MKKKHVREIVYHDERYSNDHLKNSTCKPHILKKNRPKQLLILNKGNIQNNFKIQYQSAMKDSIMY